MRETLPGRFQIFSHYIITRIIHFVNVAYCTNFGPLGLHNKLTINFRTYVRIRGVDTCFAVSTRGGHLSVWDGRAVHDWWTFVRVAATKLRLGAGSCPRDGHLCVSCKPLGLHNKFTIIYFRTYVRFQDLYNLHKILKKFFIFLFILRIDFFKNL